MNGWRESRRYRGRPIGADLRQISACFLILWASNWTSGRRIAQLASIARSHYRRNAGNSTTFRRSIRHLPCHR
jgi:hypothetical protein